MSKKQKNDEYRIELLSAAAMSACNAFVESLFEESDYEDLHWDTKLRLIKVLKTNHKLNARFQA